MLKMKDLIDVLGLKKVFKVGVLAMHSLRLVNML
jgi:hypothetical protein